MLEERILFVYKMSAFKHQIPDPRIDLEVPKGMCPQNPSDLGRAIWISDMFSWQKAKKTLGL